MNIFYNLNGVGDVLLVQLALTRPASRYNEIVRGCYVNP